MTKDDMRARFKIILAKEGIKYNYQQFERAYRTFRLGYQQGYSDGQNQWQSIETCPKDCKAGSVFGAWKDGKWVCKQMWWDSYNDQWTDYCSDYYLYPTHWCYAPDYIKQSDQEVK